MLRDPSLIPLSHQHQHALALCVQTDRAMASDPTPGTLAELARTVVQQFDSEMRAHFNAEECVLFPAMSSLNNTQELVTTLIADHRRMEALVDELRQDSRRELIVAFTALLRSHVRTEEGVLFEEAQRLLPPERLLEIGRLLRHEAIARPED